MDPLSLIRLVVVFLVIGLPAMAVISDIGRRLSNLSSDGKARELRKRLKERLYYVSLNGEVGYPYWGLYDTAGALAATASRWEAILERWPSPPANQEDVAKNEAKFWLQYLNRFTEKSATGRVLQLKSKISNEFLQDEDFILAEYFAATGVDKPSSLFSFRSNSVAYDSAYLARRESAAKNSNWFTANLETFATVSDYGPRTATTSTDHPTTDDLEYRPTSS
jgi:hypothetical protein